MIRSILASISSLALIASLAACGGGDPPPSAGEALAETQREACDRAFACRDSFPDDLGIAFEQVFGAERTACETTTDSVNGYDAEDVQASVEAGRLSYDADDFAECNRLPEDCAALWEEFVQGASSPACDTALAGTVATGGACTIPIDCQSASDSCVDDVCAAAPPATARRTPARARSLDRLVR